MNKFYFIFIIGVIAPIDSTYIFNGKKAILTSTCSWSNINGTVKPWERVEGSTYTCTAKGYFYLSGGLSKGDSSQCEYYCDKSVIKDITLKGNQVFFWSNGETKELNNPFVDTPPSGCLKISYTCTDQIDKETPLNKLSAALHGSKEIKDYYDNGKVCYEDNYECHKIQLLDAIEKNAVAPEKAVLGVRGKIASCLLTYMGIGTPDTISTCWKQLGPKCYNSQNKTKYCYDNTRKTAGITNFGAKSRPGTFWCYYANWAQYRDKPYKTDPHNPDTSLDKCTGVIYAFGTIADNKDDARYPIGAKICKEYEWNDDKQMPAVITKNPNTYLSIGGWNLGVKPWSDAAWTAESRDIFARSCFDMVEHYGFAGFDVDWEAPNFRDGVPEDVENYGLLAKRLRQEVVNRGNKHGLTTAVMVGTPVNQNFQMEKNHVYFDEIFLMTYDLHGGWNASKRLCQTAWDIGTGCGLNGVECADPTDYFYLDYAVNFYAERVPAHKLGFGLGFYGRGWQLENGVWSAASKDLSPQLKEVGVMGYAEMMNLYEWDKKCNYDDLQICCMTNDTIKGKHVLFGWDTTETMKKKMDKVFEKYGINIFFSWAYDYDILPAAPGHRELFEYAKTKKEPSLVDLGVLDNFQGKSSLSPTYQIGDGPLIVCDGLLGVVGDFMFSGISYTEFSKVPGFDNIYVANVKELKSCTPGAAKNDIEKSEKPPSISVDVNTFLPSEDPEKYLIGLDGGNHLSYYRPQVHLSCDELNSDPIIREQFVKVDTEYYFEEPTVKDSMILVPQGLHYFMDDYTFGVDYINFNTTCMNFKIESLPSCIAVTCAGDPNCINKYSPICDQANVVITDAFRSNQLLIEAQKEFDYERYKANIYTGTSTDEAPEGKILVSTIVLGVGLAAVGATAGAALGIASQADGKIENLQDQMDATNEVVTTIGDSVVTISSKLDKNIHSVNSRVDNLQDSVNAQVDVINRNFAQVRADMREIAADVNEKFKLIFNYNFWYGQMMSLTNQLTQGAIQIGRKVISAKMCLQSLAQGNMQNCPSSLWQFQNHPGIAAAPTVAAINFKNDKLIIVNRLPKKFIPFMKQVAFPMPVVKNGETCWPDYKLNHVEGKFYDELTCYNRYCEKGQLSDAWSKCMKDMNNCTFVCADCYRGICYNQTTSTISITERGEVSKKIVVKEVAEFNPLPQIVNLTELAGLIDIESIGDEIKKIQNVTAGTVKLESIKEDLEMLQTALYKYEAIMAQLTLGTMSNITFYVYMGIIAFVTLYVIIDIFVKCCKNKNNGYSKIPTNW